MTESGGVRHLAPSEARVKNVLMMRHAIEHHAGWCEELPIEIRMHPEDHGALGIEELWGLPIRSRDDVQQKRFVLVCLGDHSRVEKELAAFLHDATSG